MAKDRANGHQTRNTAATLPRPGDLDGEVRVAVRAIAPSPLNPRKRFGEEEIARLAESIEADGLLQPIVVVPSVSGSGWEIVAGERRWRAVTRLGWQDVPVRILERVDEATHRRLALIENLARVDLDPIEEAQGYAALQETGMTQAAIGEAIRRSQPTIANRLRLLGLPPDVQARISAGELSPSHGVALARYAAFPKLLTVLADRAAREQWSTKVLEGDLGGLPESWHLTRDGVIALVRQYDAEFDISQCAACPFGAKFGDYCVNVAHYKELQRAAREGRAQALREAAEKAKASGEKLLQLEKMAYGTYESLAYQQRPAGCSEACKCAKNGARGDGELVPICVDPSRFRKLKAAEKNAEKRGRQETGRMAAARATMLISLLTEPGSKELAVLVARVLDGIHRPGMLKEVAERHAPSLLPVLKAQGSRIDWSSAHLMIQLEGLTPMELIRFGVEALLQHQVIDRYGGEYFWADSNKLAVRYLGLEQAPAQPDEPGEDGDYPRESDQPCGRCGGVVVLNSELEDRELAAMLARGEATGILCDACGDAEGAPAADSIPELSMAGVAL